MSDEPALGSSDEAIASRNLQQALEKSLSGESLRWQNPSNGTSGTVTPVSTWKTANGTYCRSYRERITLGSGESVRRNGVACRSPEAVWRAT
ncbi:hypothetical protein FMN50_17875 [Rhodobacterales bacterium]|nr:hypothetical protein FMN50_17875 [Rhodobacterales bacterium]